MNNINWIYPTVLILGVFISSVSQVILKKAAMKKYSSVIREYLNPGVIVAYTIFVLATLMTVFAYKGLPLSWGPILDSSGYLFVTIWGVTLFKEKITARKAIAIAIIVIGIIIYSI